MNSVELLEDLVALYSPTGEEQFAVRYLAGQMNCMGYAAGIDEIGNVVGVRGQGSREILLLGHIDTVPGRVTQRREGNLLYGRGTVDAKGPLAAFTCAAAAVEVPDGWRIRVVGAVGEEGNSRGAHHLARTMTPPEMVIIGEPSSWQAVTLGYKGSIWLNYQARRPLAHTAARSASACEEAVAFWNQLQTMCETYNAPVKGVFDQLTPTLRMMKSDNDGLYESAGLQIGLRTPPALTAEQVTAMIAAFAGEEAAIGYEDSLPAYKADKNTPLVRAFLSAIRQLNGKPTFTVKTGTADMNVVAPRWQCPIVAYGPGDSSLDHTPDEHIDLQEYQTAIDVLKVTLQSIMRA